MNAVLSSSIRVVGVAIFSMFLLCEVRAEECIRAISQPVVDFGQSQRAQLLEGERVGKHLLVGTRVVSLNVSCSAATALALSFSGEPVGDQGYRFARNGVFTLRVLGAQLDGRPVDLMMRDAEGAAHASDNQLRAGVSLVPGYQNQISRGTTFSAQVEIKTYVDDRDTRARSSDQWNGGGEFAINTF